MNESESLESDLLNRRRKSIQRKNATLLDDSTKRLTIESDNDSSKKLPLDGGRDSTINDSRKIYSDKKSESNKKLPTKAAFGEDIERKSSEVKRDNSIAAKKKSNAVFDGQSNNSLAFEVNNDPKKGFNSADLLRRATTKDLTNLSGQELPGRSSSFSWRNSVASDDDYRKQQPVLTRINSKINGLLKNIRWGEENDESRARKMVKSLVDFKQIYSIQSSLGHGTQGKIYLGTCIEDGTAVVVKIVEESSIKSFNYVGKLPVSIFLLKILNNREDRSNPLFLRYIDYYHFEKTWTLVTEYEGKSWVDVGAFLKKRKNPLNEFEIMGIFSGIVRAVCDLETLGFTHNDIKDSNILIDSETLSIKLIDLDSCRQISDDLIPSSEFAGTIFYASPEIRTGNFFSPQLQDIYAIGIVMISIIFNGRIPEEISKYLGGEKDILDPHTVPKILKDKNIDISPGLIKSIQNMISRKASKRPNISDLLGFVIGD